MQINPLCQVPTLRLDDGSVMTESAAIALMILDSRPDLAPAPGTRAPAVSASVDLAGGQCLPYVHLCRLSARWTADAPEQLRENCIRYRQSLYLWLEQQLTAAPYALGADMSLLDCYIAAMCSWGRGGRGLWRTRQSLSPWRTKCTSGRSYSRFCVTTS